MNIIWDWNNQKITGNIKSTRAITEMTLVLRDVYAISLYYVTEQSVNNAPYVAGAIPDGKSILFSAKLPASLSGSPLIRTSAWTASGSGTSTVYTDDISCNTAELIAAIGAESSLALKAEFVLVRADGTNECSTQFDLTIIPDVNREDDANATNVSSVVAQFILQDGTKCVKLINADGTVQGVWGNGAAYTYCPDDGLWYPLLVKIQDGIAVHAIGEGIAI